MYLIDLVYLTVLTIANSDIRGNVKPDAARRLINLSVEEIYEGYFYELNRMLNRQNKGLVGRGVESISSNIRDKINHYLENIELDIDNSELKTPNDLRYLITILADDSEVEVLKSLSEFNVLKKSTTKSYPIGYRRSTDTMLLYPIGYNKVFVSYLRKPKIPNWTYVEVRGSEVFNPSSPDFQELDIHASEVSNVIIKTLQKVGINLKEQDLQQVMQQVIQQQQNIEFNQEMTS